MSLIQALMPFAGIWIMICVSFAKSTVQALAKYVSVRELYDIPIFEILFFITAFQIIPGFISLACTHLSKRAHVDEEAPLTSQRLRRSTSAADKFNQIRDWVLSVGGAVCGACVIVFQFAALRHMSIGNASVIFWTCPAILYVLSIIFGREHVTTVKTLCLLLILFGSMLVIKPEAIFHDKEAESSEHVPISRYVFQHGGFALLAALLQAISFIMKRAEEEIGPMGFIIRGFVASIACVLWTLIEDRDRIVPPFTVIDNHAGSTAFSAAILPWLAILISAVIFCASEYAQEEACLKESVSTVGCVGALEVVFSFTWQVVMFNDVPDWISFSGAACIFISVLVLIVRKKEIVNAAEESGRQIGGVDNDAVIAHEEEEPSKPEKKDSRVKAIASENDSDERQRLL